MSYILFQLNEKLFLKDPQSTSVGQAILAHSIGLIDRYGFEEVTFRKIADDIQSTEATVYRYFENKFRLLQYLTDWYWTIMNFQIDFHSNNIESPEERLKVCLQLLAGTRKFIPCAPIDVEQLHRIVVAESDKTYLSKNITKDYKNGLLDPFKQTCATISSIIRDINPRYPYPNSLVSTLLNTALHQVHFAHHMPSFSDLKADQKNMNEKLYHFLESFAFNNLKSAA